MRRLASDDEEVLVRAEVADSGETLEAENVLSSAGAAETVRLAELKDDVSSRHEALEFGGRAFGYEPAVIEHGGRYLLVEEHTLRGIYVFKLPSLEEAKAVCHRCPVIDTCLTWAFWRISAGLPSAITEPALKM